MTKKEKKEKTESLDEFKADHSDSSVPEPIDTGSTARGADKDNGEKAPQSIDTDGVTTRSREGLIGRTISDLKNAPKEFVQSIFDQVRDHENNSPDKNKRPADKMANGDKKSKKINAKMAKEAIEVIFKTEEGEAPVEIGEGFIEKATVVFENAVNLRVEEERGTIAEAYETKLEEQNKENMNTLSESLSEFLDAVSSVWLEQNEVAIESAIKVEIAEDLFKGLKTIFEAYNINISEDKLDVVEGITKDLEEAETRLTESVLAMHTLEKELDEYKVNEKFIEIAEGLTTTQQDKFYEMAMGMEYNSIDEYAKKLNIIKETYFSKGSVTKTDETPLDDAAVGKGDKKVTEMSAYSKQISKMARK